MQSGGHDAEVSGREPRLHQGECLTAADATPGASNEGHVVLKPKTRNEIHQLR